MVKLKLIKAKLLLISVLSVFLSVCQVAAQGLIWWTPENGLPAEGVNDLCFGPQGKLWLASEGGGLIRFDGQDFKTFGSRERPLLNEVFRMGDLLMVSSFNQQWSFDGRAFKRLDTLVERPASQSNQPLVLEGFLATYPAYRNYISGVEPEARVLFDARGGVYLASRKGLAYLASKHIQVGPGALVSFYQHELLRFEGRQNGLHVLKNGEPLSHHKIGLVWKMKPWQGALLIASETGLYRYDYERNSLTVTPLQGFIFDLIEQEAKLWAASDRGLYQVSQRGYQEQVLPEELEGATVSALRTDQEERLYLVTYTKGVWYLEEGSWQPLDTNLNQSLIQSFWPINRKEYFVLSRQDGLWHYHPQGAKLYPPSALAYSDPKALFYWQNDLWLATKKGFCSLKDLQLSAIGELSFVLPGYQDGIPLVLDSVLYGAGSAGSLRWDADFFPTLNSSQSQVLGVKGLQQEGDSLWPYGDPYESFQTLPANLVLPHDLNYLEIDYGWIAPYWPEKVNYRYRLIGQSEQWTEAGTLRKALMANLGPGSYRFEVQGRYPWQDWQRTASYTFVIATPFWLTWWFWTAAALSISSLLFLWLRDRWKRREARLLLEQELMDMERKALRLQMNPHFIFNALDSISSFIFKNDQKQAVRYLNNFAKLMRYTLESSMEPIHPVENEVSILKNYLELEKLRFSGHFDYEIVVDEEISYDVGLPPMLLQPHVENAVLHGLKPKSEKGFLKISFTLEEDILVCEIEDDGIGRAAAKALGGQKPHRSMASRINEDRIELLRRSENAAFNLEIIDKTDEEGKASGTRVIIRLPAKEL